jgi:hemoglobin
MAGWFYISRMKTDIVGRKDIEKLVAKFYEKVMADSLLAPVFGHVDWPHHLPIISNFWSSILLGDKSYEGNPFQKHVNLPLTNAHFDRWLTLFEETVNENFAGITANEAKSRANTIAGIFRHKLGIRI